MAIYTPKGAIFPCDFGQCRRHRATFDAFSMRSPPPTPSRPFAESICPKAPPESASREHLGKPVSSSLSMSFEFISTCSDSDGHSRFSRSVHSRKMRRNPRDALSQSGWSEVGILSEIFPSGPFFQDSGAEFLKMEKQMENGLCLMEKCGQSGILDDATFPSDTSIFHLLFHLASPYAGEFSDGKSRSDGKLADLTGRKWNSILTALKTHLDFLFFQLRSGLMEKSMEFRL